MWNLAICGALLILASEALLQTPSAVLVLGSGGLVGRAAVRWLRAHQYEVLEVRNRRHIDLRRADALEVYNASNIAYCIFLACEVGGSKFIDSPATEVQMSILTSNLKIYQTVLPWLQQRRIPFIFTSSYLQETPNAYGTIKRLGEQWVMQLGGLGKILRLWNVYGEDEPSHAIKGHVLSDWASQCARNNGTARSLTDGHEERQFVHVNDTAAACGLAITRHHELDMISDVSSGQWTTMRQAAKLLEASGACRVFFPDQPTAPFRVRRAASLHGFMHSMWTAQVPLERGCDALMWHARMP